MSEKSNNEIKRYKFDNQLQLITINNKEDRGISSFQFVSRMGDAPMLTRFGDEALGAAHLIEHCLFKDSEHSTMRDFNRKTATYGASINAFTSKDEVRMICYACLNDYFKKLYPIMADMFMNPRFRPDQVEPEKRPVLQEIDQYDSSYLTDMWMNFTSLIYGENSVLGKPILGTRESVKSIQPDQMRRYWNQAVEPQNLVFIVESTPENNELVVKQWEEYFKQHDLVQKNFVYSEDLDSFSNIDSGIEYEYFKKPGEMMIMDRPELKQYSIKLGYPKSLMAPRYTNEYFHYEFMLDLVSKALNQSFVSRTWTEFREKRGAAYSSGTANVWGMPGRVPGYFMQSGTYNADPKMIIERSVDIMRDIGRKGLRRNEIEMARACYKTELLNNYNRWSTLKSTAQYDFDTLGTRWFDTIKDVKQLSKIVDDAVHDKLSVKWSDVVQEFAQRDPVVVCAGPNHK